MRAAIIPARGGSRRIPLKNIRMFQGKPIIAYSILAARESGLFDRIVVSSDDPKIRKVARQYGADAIEREMRYAMDDVGTQEVVRDAIVEMDVLGWTKDMHEVCCIYATAPMLRAEDLSRGYYAMCATGRYAYVHGWYYWGRTAWFGDVALSDGLEWERPADRWIDINTEEDWQLADRMYADLHKEAA